MSVSSTANAANTVRTAPVPDVPREKIEQFLYHEAHLIDSWELKQWLELFAPEGKYFVPSLDYPDASEDSSLYFIADDHKRLTARVQQLLSAKVWAENPKSRVRHFVTNILVESTEGDVVTVRSNFIVHRARRDVVDTYVGHYLHRLKWADDRFSILSKRVTLDLFVLRPHGKITIIL